MHRLVGIYLHYLHNDGLFYTLILNQSLSNKSLIDRSRVAMVKGFYYREHISIIFYSNCIQAFVRDGSL